MALSAVIWRDKFWNLKGSYGYSGGHQNHAHLEARTSDEIVQMGKWLQGRGFRVAEHPAFGVVHRVHKGRAHYEGRAIDVNFGPAGANNIERSAFDSLIPSVIHQGLTVSRLKPPPPPKKDEDMPSDAYFNLKFAELKNEVNERTQVAHDSIAERIAKLARLIKANEAKDQGRADQILEELEKALRWDVPADG